MKSSIDIALHLENDHACSEVLFFLQLFCLYSKYILFFDF